MHPAIEEILQFFEYKHLPDRQQAVSKPFHSLAHYLVEPPGLVLGESGHGAEVTAGLRKLLEAKDCFVRASLPAPTR